MRSVKRKSGVSATVRVKFTRRLLAWWARAARDLPWRRTRDPYRVLVSEFMLQQTQVSRVAEYYPRFLERFPDLETLARARPRAVREARPGSRHERAARTLESLLRRRPATPHPATPHPGTPHPATPHLGYRHGTRSQ